MGHRVFSRQDQMSCGDPPGARGAWASQQKEVLPSLYPRPFHPPSWMESATSSCSLHTRKGSTWVPCYRFHCGLKERGTQIEGIVGATLPQNYQRIRNPGDPSPEEGVGGGALGIRKMMKRGAPVPGASGCRLALSQVLVCCLHQQSWSCSLVPAMRRGMKSEVRAAHGGPSWAGCFPCGLCFLI